MQRSLLRPLRTRRPLVLSAAPVPNRRAAPLPMTLKTRKTLAAIGVLWLAFAAPSAHATPPAAAAPAVRLDPKPFV